MFPCGNVFQMEVCSFYFTLDEMVPRKSKIIISFFLGAVESICLGT